MTYAGIVAGGSGTRMGASIPKQYIEICGKPIIVRTAEVFVRCRIFDRIFIAVPKQFVSMTEELIARHINGCENITVIEGGNDRNGSVCNIISALRSHDSCRDSLLVTHDGVRPFVTEAMIAECVLSAREHGVSGVYIPSTDTIVSSIDGHIVNSVPDRSQLFNTQTPQAFKTGLFEDAFAQLSDDEKKNLTDVSGLFRKVGKDVHMVMGSTENIKITTPIDIAVAEAVIKSRELQQ